MWPARECSSWMSAAATIRIVTADDTLRRTTTTRTTSLFCTGDEVHDAVNGRTMSWSTVEVGQDRVSLLQCLLLVAWSGESQRAMCRVKCVCVAQDVP